MKAVNHYVVVDRIKEKQKETSGLILDENKDEQIRYFKGKVISAGNLVEAIKKDDIVWYDRHAGYGIQFEEKFYFVIKASDIVLVD
tara:strand:- start:219 stop:476 length:258 start_codon:yes stop_codon:yes gene_type:complete